MAEESGRLAALRDQLENALLQTGSAYVNGNTRARLPHVTNISFQYTESQLLMMSFAKEIALSSGSACTSASLEPSYVLKAMGLDDDLAHSSLRFSLGRFTTQEQISYVISVVTQSIRQLRETSPLWASHHQ